MKQLLGLCGNVAASLVFAALFASVTFASYSFFEAIRGFDVEEKHQPRVQRPPPDCDHLYNVDRHREWAECMGVGYK